MSTVQLFKRDVKANSSPRNAFDISYSSIFSSPCGLILPCYIEDVKAKDKIKLNATSVCRTRPVNTSAFMQFDEVVDFFYVPYRLIWSAYNQWRLSQSFPHSSSSLYNVGNQYLLPHCTWTNVYSGLKLINNSSNKLETAFLSPNVPDCLRLLDLLNYGAIPSSNFSSHSFEQSLDANSELDSAFNKLYTKMDNSGLRFNYFRLAAYQCVYQHAFRNVEYEPMDASYYNCDSLFLQGADAPTPINDSQLSRSTPVNLLWSPVGVQSNVINLRKLFTPRYKNYRDDLFTKLKPQSGFDSSTMPLIPIQGDPGANGSSFDWPIDPSLLPVTPETLDFDLLQKTPANTANPVMPLPVSNDVTFMYAQNIYQLLARDKFARSMVYADKTYASQMKALFGVTDTYDEHKPQYLGSFNNSVSISDVVATGAGSDGEGVNASTSVLGEIAGKGYGNTSNKVFERTFDEDGIVIGMHYIMPRNNYDSYRTNKFNTKVSRFDYFYPQFDGLGLQPTFSYERGLFGGEITAEPTILSITGVLGYSPRYYEYKTRQSETHGSFQSFQPDYDWTLSNNIFNIENGANYLNYKINPCITDRLFTVKYDGSMQTDPFICYFHFDATRVSDLEAFGTPSL